MLQLADVAQPLPVLRPLLEQLDEGPRDVTRVPGSLREEVEELALLRRQPEGHRAFLADRFTKSSREREPDRAREPRGEAIDRERGQRVGLEEPHQELDGEI